MISNPCYLAQYTLPNLNGVDPNYLYPQALAKQLSPYNSTQWSSEDGQIYDISAEFNHDAYLSLLEQNSSLPANGTTVPTGGLFWFQVRRSNSETGMFSIVLNFLKYFLFCVG